MLLFANAGCEVDLSKFKQNDFRENGREEFEETAKKIVKSSLTVTEMSLKTENRYDMDEFESALQGEFSREGKGSNSKKITVSSVFDELDTQVVEERVNEALGTIGKAPFVPKRNFGSLKKH